MKRQLRVTADLGIATAHRVSSLAGHIFARFCSRSYDLERRGFLQEA